MMRLDKEEKELADSIEKGNWKRISNFGKEKLRYQEIAKATIRKDKRVNIRISQKDLESLQVRALQEGLPYQTLVSSVLHKYLSGRLKEKAA
jgi:predicted DNA binding CopG/RHH family protein